MTTPTPFPAEPDEGPLERAEEAIEAARRYEERADPLGDGSYFGDASKASMIDTPDLEAYEAAQAERARAARERLHDTVAADSHADAVDFGAQPTRRPEQWSAEGAADAGAAESPAEQRAREADAEERERRWAERHGKPVDPASGDDGL